MIRKITSIIGIIGVLVIVAVGIIDHITLMNDKPYFITLGVGFVLFVPMLVRELLLFRKKQKNL